MVRILLGWGADPNLKNQRGYTALTRAAYPGHVEIVQVLSEWGADLKIVIDVQH